MKTHFVGNTSEESLLYLPLQSLDLNLRRSAFLNPLIKQVLSELNQKGFYKFRPHFYLGDEWFSPEGECAVAIPFFLAHKKLLLLEKKHTGEAEGETKESCLALLRHEIGHCIDHCYKLHKTSRWVQLFGNPEKPYNPDSYSYDPKSQDFVINLGDHYAQAHPDEDFAETFAVWLANTKKSWTKQYKSFPKALKKIQYVDEVMKELEDRSFNVNQKNLIYQQHKLRISLKNYYHKKRRQMIA